MIAHYDDKFRRHRQLCLSILKRFGFGQRVMETTILMEVEQMINEVREQQGRPFDMRQLITSCVANVIMNVIIGCRFYHSDPAFQHLIRDVNEFCATFSPILEIFPALRFLPYFRGNLARHFSTVERQESFIKNIVTSCIEVRNYFHYAVV